MKAVLNIKYQAESFLYFENDAMIVWHLVKIQGIIEGYMVSTESNFYVFHFEFTFNISCELTHTHIHTMMNCVHDLLYV